MSGWQILTWLSVCVAGALLFLEIIAQELERSGRSLQDLEAKELKAYRRRKADKAEAVTAVGRDGVVQP